MTNSAVRPDNMLFIEQLKSIVGTRHVLASNENTQQYRKGYRFGDGPALAVVRPGNLVEQWRVLKTCVAANKIIIAQAANTGLTGGSTPDGSGYDRDIVIVNTLRITKIRLIGNGRQAICHSGSTLMDLEKALMPYGREPHSVIGSSCIGASVVGGICNNSGGALIRRGPAYTQFALFARVDEAGLLQLVNHLAIRLGHEPEEILAKLDRGAFTDADVDFTSPRCASDHEYEEHVRDFSANTPARFNADPKRLFEASGSAGKVMIFAVRLDTFHKEQQTKTFYIGTNDPSELTRIRCHILAHFKELPICAEYLHRDAFDIAEKYGKDTFLTIRLLGSEWLPTLFALKGRFDAFLSRFSFAPDGVSDRLLQAIGRVFPNHLPRRLLDYRDRFSQHLLLKISGDGILETKRFLATMFPSARGDFFECTEEEGEKAFLHRFVAAGAGIRYRTLHPREVEDIVAIDVALRRNDPDWFEHLPEHVSGPILHALYYGHFFCYVFHQDYIVRKGHNTNELERKLWYLLEMRGAQFPAEHSLGHLYHAKPNLIHHYKSLDPSNSFNPGIGRSTKNSWWQDNVDDRRPRFLSIRT